MEADRRLPENAHEPHTVDARHDRRTVMGFGLLAVGALLVGGCQSSHRRISDASAQIPDRPISRPSPKPTASPELSGPAPGVLPRREWTSAGVITSLANPMVRVERITVHHDGMPPVSLRSKADIARRIETIRKAHVGQEWADIGYHYIVDPLGNVWEGRPIRYQGAHVKPANERNMGVLVLGNFMDQRPSSAATTALDGFVSSQMKRLRIPLSRVYTHQELSPTACPGVNLQRYMVETRSSRGRLAKS